MRSAGQETGSLERQTGQTRRFALVATLGVLLLTLAACTKTAAPTAALPKLGDVKGTVTLNGAPATGGQALKEGDAIHVAEGGMARIEYPDKSQFLVVGLTGEGADWTLDTGKKDGALSVILVRLGKGVVSFFVTPETSPTRRFEIGAESSLTVVRGTEGKVETGTSGDTVALKHGEVTVQNKAGTGSVTIHQGQQVTIGTDGKVGEPVPYDFSTTSEQKLYNSGALLLKSLGN